MKSNTLPMVVVATLCLFLSSCGHHVPQSSLEYVAKDWCLTIRASQVMPLYPLEEDIRPGDVYLITSSVESDIKSWQEKGFLPMINRYDRISIPRADYDRFYREGFEQTGGPSFSRAPKAAFPSYSFSVDKRGSAGIAVPLSSVPLALSMAGAQEATGNVVLMNAATQGLPDRTMDILVRNWAKDHELDLKYQAKITSNPLLLRVITRIFTIGQANVSLTFAKTVGANLQAGSPPATPELSSASVEGYNKLIEELNKEIELIKTTGNPPSVEIPDSEAEERSTDAEIAALQAQLAALERLKARAQMAAYERQIERTAMIDQYGGYLLPGASVRVVGRSAHGVTMTETFTKPLVVGYWATEYLVSEWGKITLIGKVRDLVDDPDEYINIVNRAKEMAGTVPEKPQIDDPNKDPFNN